MSASRELVEDKLDAKDDARNNRLNIRKNNLEVFRKEFQKESKLKCADVIKQFGECAQRNGLMVVFRCHKENKASKSLSYHSLMLISN